MRDHQPVANASLDEGSQRLRASLSIRTDGHTGLVTVQPETRGPESYVVFGGFADILPSGCTLLAESAVAVEDIDRDDLARRIEDASEDAADAMDDQTRTRAEEYLAQLTTLQAALAG